MVDPKKRGERRDDDEIPVDEDDEVPPVTVADAPSERWEKDGFAGTLRMTGSPPRPASRPPRMASSPPRARANRGVELFVIDETQLPGAERKPWRAAEIWTKRRVYGLDSTFKCFEVLDRETGRPESNHELIGARLGGGRLREKDTVKFSYPLPLPGMEAMFMKGRKHGYTSAVDRMIVRVRVLHTSADDATPSWEEIANRWSDVPPKP
jgi:hypothetical protein